jgi:carbon dioxide concentrating mechanism protein CcmN
MSLPTLQLRSISTAHYYASGDVTIQSGAAIAPGVLLQADADSSIVIKTGACIGFGSILHARQGKVEVGEGANIGAEVLLIGQVEIGANACVGSASTVLNTTIAAGQVVPPGSLLGDNSSPGVELQATDTVVLPPSAIPLVSAPPAAMELESPPAAPIAVNVYGQVYVNKMLGKMFPNSARLNTTAQPNPTDPPTGAQDPWDD